MSTLAYDAVKGLVIEKLNEITVSNGYFSNVTVLDGWLTFYADDLAKGLNGKTFPAVSVHYDKDLFSVQSGQTSSKTTRDLKITGAVSTTDHTLVNKLIDELRIDVCKAIGGDRRS